MREILIDFEIRGIEHFRAEAVLNRIVFTFDLEPFYGWIVRKCTKRMMSKHIKISLSSKVYYFMDLTVFQIQYGDIKIIYSTNTYVWAIKYGRKINGGHIWKISYGPILYGPYEIDHMDLSDVSNI